MSKPAPDRDKMVIALRVDREQVRSKEPLRACVRDAIDNYFSELAGHPTKGLYRMVLAEVEAPLLESVMRHTKGNHSKAAEFLGINRGTLRKKLKQYRLE